MKVLITGGAGYLGLNIIDYLDPIAHGRNLDTKIIVLDPQDPPSNYFKQWSFNCDFLRCCIDVEFVKGDVCDLDEVKRLADQVDSILHLAFVVGGPSCKKNPNDATRLALRGTENVVKASQGKMIVFSSSDAVYGNEANGIIDENTPCNPASLYGQLKLQCEEIVKSSSKYCIFRMPSNFGVSSALGRWDMLVHYLFKQMYKYCKIDIADPLVTRTLIDVRDTGRAFRFVLNNQENSSGKIFNIASGAWTKQEIADTIRKIIGGEVGLDKTFTDSETRNFILDCSAIQKIGWTSEFSLKDGVNWINDYIETYESSNDSSTYTIGSKDYLYVPHKGNRSYPWHTINSFHCLSQDHACAKSVIKL